MHDGSTSMSTPKFPSAVGQDAVKTSRGEETKARILHAALDLFREKGYDDTTMRAVAERAGVSLGNAYYYYASKENLLQGYYAKSHEEHVAASKPILEREKDLKARLLGVTLAKLDVSEPYHRFASLLFRTASDPASPLNPFSADSAPTRKEAIALCDEVLQGSTKRIPKDLAARLPELLWLFQMGIILFWIHDGSKGREKTRRLAERSTDLVVKLIYLASNPFVAPLRKSALKLLEEAVGPRPA